MTVLECPAERLLTDYLAGRLDGPTHEAVDEHLDACPACQSTADGLEAAVDSSFPGLTPAPCPTTPENPAFLRLVDRVKALGAGGPTPTCEKGRSWAITSCWSRSAAAAWAASSRRSTGS